MAIRCKAVSTALSLLAADRLTGDGSNALDQWQASRKVSTLGKETGQRFGRIDGDEIANIVASVSVDPVEALRCAGGSIPDKEGHEARTGKARGCHDGYQDEAGAGHDFAVPRDTAGLGAGEKRIGHECGTLHGANAPGSAGTRLNRSPSGSARSIALPTMVLIGEVAHRTASAPLHSAWRARPNHAGRKST